MKWCWGQSVYFVPKALDTYGNKVKIVMIKEGKEKPGEGVYPQKKPSDQLKIRKKIDELYVLVYMKNA